MFRKVSNYLAIFSISLIMASGSILANPLLAKDHTTEHFVVEDGKDSSYFSRIIHAGHKHSYTLKAGNPKAIRAFIRADKDLKINVKTPNGEDIGHEAERFFEVTFNAEGEFTLELESLALSRYSIEFSKR